MTTQLFADAQLAALAFVFGALVTSLCFFLVFLWPKRKAEEPTLEPTKTAVQRYQASAEQIVRVAYLAGYQHCLGKRVAPDMVGHLLEGEEASKNMRASMRQAGILCASAYGDACRDIHEHLVERTELPSEHIAEILELGLRPARATVVRRNNTREED